MDKPQWENPDDFSMAFRCMKQKDARPFFEKGRIKFGTPRSWVGWEKKHGNGRGDQLKVHWQPSTSLMSNMLSRPLKSTMQHTMTLNQC